MADGRLSSEALIEKLTAGNFGLAPGRWLAQLDAIRSLAERAWPADSPSDGVGQ